MQAQTPEVSAEKATTPAEQRLVSVEQQILDLILDQCRYWHGRDEARRGGFAILYAEAKEVAANAAPIALSAPTQVTAAMWKAAHDSMESDGDLALALQEALNAAPQSRQTDRWQIVTKPGQIEVGDWLSFTVAGCLICAKARDVLNPGTDREEVIYNRARNYYFITRMAADGTSTHKGVMRAASSVQGGA